MLMITSKKKAQYFCLALHFYLVCTPGIAFASLRGGRGFGGGQEHGGVGAVAAGKRVGGRLGWEQRSQRNACQATRKGSWERKKSTQAFLWDGKAAELQHGTPNLLGSPPLSKLQGAASPGCSTGVGRDTAQQLPPTQPGGLGWWHLVAGGWDATQRTPSILLAPRGG